MSKCATCKFFNKTPEDWLDRPTAYGECAKIKFEERRALQEEVSDGELACVTDGEDYYAGLRVKPEFGCVLWDGVGL